MSPKKSELERGRDNKITDVATGSITINLPIKSIHAAVMQNAIETRQACEAIEELTKHIDRFTDAVLRYLETKAGAR